MEAAEIRRTGGLQQKMQVEASGKKAYLRLREKVLLNASHKSGITNSFVERLGRLMCTDAYFEGVEAADMIPYRLANKVKTILIINLALNGEFLSGRQTAGHFVVVVLVSGHAYYFDPLGMPPTEPHVLRFLKHAHRPVTNVVQHPIQHFASAACGLFALFYAKIADDRAQGIQHSPDAFPFYTRKCDLLKNDHLVLKYLIQLSMATEQKKANSIIF